MTKDNRIRSIGRRTFLKTGAVLAGGALTASTVGAAPKLESHGDPIWGEEATVGDGTMRTYATTNPAGKLSSLGVYIDSDAMAAFGDEEAAAHLRFPHETGGGEEVDTHQFTFLSFHYNPGGHPPPGIYNVPHIDLHFYMLGEEDVESISGGPLAEAPLPFLGLADYEIPDEQFPPGYTFEEHRFIVKEMGEHLLDETAPEFHGEEFTHTNVYGAYDPSIDPANPDGSKAIELGGDCVELPVYEGDGEGRLTFVEPMITTDFLRNDLTEEVAVDVATPEVFFEADHYPTAYVIEPDGDGGVYVSIDSFEEFPGPSD